MKEVSYNEYSKLVLDTLPKGAFLTTSHAGKINSMTIGWGSIGVIWRIPIFMVMVRPSRHTWGLIEAAGEFTVSVPLQDMSKALGICGTKSGRDTDKLALAGLKTLPGQVLSTPVIAGAGLHYECKVVFKQAMNPPALDGTLSQECYPTGDFHTMYFGKILSTWTE